MKDAYSFAVDKADAVRCYQKMFLGYLRTFARLGLKAIPMRAESGAIGGDLSHEFIVLAQTGESKVFCDADWLALDVLSDAPDYHQDLTDFFAKYTSLYAATEDRHDPERSPIPQERLIEKRGIEVGHIFYFGTKYSKPLGASVTLESGESVPVEMGSYGIGISRLVGALIEANHDPYGIVWPLSIAPFQTGLIDLGGEECRAFCEDFYRTLGERGIETLYDDRKESAGIKFSDMDLIGLPWQVIVGPRGLKSGVVELKNRQSGQRETLSPESALAHLHQHQAQIIPF